MYPCKKGRIGYRHKQVQTESREDKARDRGDAFARQGTLITASKQTIRNQKRHMEQILPHTSQKEPVLPTP